MLVVSGTFLSQKKCRPCPLYITTVRPTTQGLKNLINAFANLHNEAMVASTVWYFHLMAVGSILEQAKLGSSKAAFALWSH